MPELKTSTLLQEGRSLYEEGRFQAAADRLLRAFRQDPDDAECALVLGIVLHAAGDLQNAEMYLSRAYTNDPDRPESLWNLAAVLREQGREKEAANLLLHSLESGADPVRLAIHAGNWPPSAA